MAKKQDPIEEMLIADALRKFVPEAPAIHKHYIQLNKLLGKAKHDEDVKSLALAVQEMLKDVEFSAWIARDKTVPKTLTTANDCWTVAKRYLYRILWGRDYAGAALLLWGPEIFDPRPRSVGLIMDALSSSSLVNAMGGASSGKTYSGIAWALLDWILDPEWTMIRLVGPTHDHLQQNMFADLVRLHEGSVIPLPGKVDTESLSTNKTRGMGFSTVALDRGPAASAKLKGIKTKPRDANDHPLFGRSARVRILIDEAQEVPINAWDMLLNAISNRESDEHLKIYCAANPSDENSKYGKNCKPLGGWATITPLQEKWVSETGWTTVRLNAMLSENVKAAKDNDEFKKRKLVIFPRLISWEKVSHIIRGAGGDDQDARVYTQVYGMFPPSGIKQSVIKQAHVEASKGEWIFTGPTTTYLTFDPAYSGDRPAVASGRYGLARGWIDYDGEIHKLDAPLKAIQIDTVGVIPQSDDTQAMVDDVLELAKQLRVAPECFGIDKTGVGRGCHDLIRMQWATTILGKQTAEPSDILGICYSESASETKVLDEDTSTPSELYDNTSSELWYAAGKLFERGVIKIGKGVDALAIDELVGRNGGRVTGKARRQAVETKPAYKARGNRSPDFADAITMLIHTVRLREDFSPKAEKTPDEAPVSPYEVDRAWDAANPFGTPAGMEELQKDETKVSWNDLLGNN